MFVVHLGAQHHRPIQLPIVDGGVVCLLTGSRQPIGACSRCPHLQGSLGGPDPALLCDVPRAARRAERATQVARHRSPNGRSSNRFVANGNQ